MLASAKAGVNAIIKMEPKIIEDGTNPITVSIQPDSVAGSGDIRDVLIIRHDIKWEIGISVKHNHEALKHSRLSKKIDFGNAWYGIPVTKQYFDEISLLFTKLQNLKTQGVKWRDVPNKEQSVYIPVLNAFMGELQRAYTNHNDNVTTGLIKYLLGSNGYDYYKVIHHNNHTAKVIPYNIYGLLNQASDTKAPDTLIPTITLPTRIIELAFKDNSKATVHLTMDNGWAISFRIHNASSKVEPSLKFDIQLLGQPSSLFFIDIAW